MSDAGIDQNMAQFGRFTSRAATHVGMVRKLNEDAFVNRPDLGLWAVADGAGGHQSGDVASAAVAKALQGIPIGLNAGQIMAEVRLRLEATHAYLREEAARRGPGMMLATTVVVLLARGDYFVSLWAGDSRAYLLRGQELTQISHDHSLVQELVDNGTITAEEAEKHPRANVITRAIGAHTDALELDKRTGRLIAEPPSQHNSACRVMTCPRAAVMLAASSRGKTASMVAPVRSRATMTGTCSADNPRLAALPPRLRGARGRPPRLPLKDSRMNVSSASTIPDRFWGLSRLRPDRNRCLHRNAVA